MDCFTRKVLSCRIFNKFEPDFCDETLNEAKRHEAWLYLAVLIDLLSRRVAGWSPQPRITTNLALQPRRAALWRRKPKAKVMIHSDQGYQFTSREWQLFLSKHDLDASMSRRGNCHDNVVAESLLQLLSGESIRRRTYLPR